jgi:hypothetical protein
MKRLLLALAATLAVAACGKTNAGANAESQLDAARTPLRGRSAGGNSFTVARSADFKSARLTWDATGEQIAFQQITPSVTVRCPCSFYEGFDALGAKASLMIELSNVKYTGSEPDLGETDIGDDIPPVVIAPVHAFASGLWNDIRFDVDMVDDTATLTWSDDNTQLVAKLTTDPLGPRPRCICKIYEKVGPDAIRDIYVEGNTATYVRTAVTVRD